MPDFCAAAGLNLEGEGWERGGGVGSSDSSSSNRFAGEEAATVSAFTVFTDEDCTITSASTTTAD